MIFVTGTKRSGTSMWMQILIEAGFPYIGKPYPKNWLNSIGDANKEGFYESSLRRGVFHATNPDPKTGAYIRPEKSKRHTLKVFIPGLICSDLAFIYRVVGTIRPWREYVSSIRRLYTMEDAFLRKQPKAEKMFFTPWEMARMQRGTLHPALEWWRENYDLIRDFATRRYAFNLVSYLKLLEDPEGIVVPVLKWCGAPDIQKGIAEVERSLRTQKKVSIADSPLTSEQEMLFDEFHEFFFRQDPLSASFIDKLNAINSVLAPIIDEERKKGMQRLRDVLMNAGLREHEAEKTLEKAQEEGR